MCFYPWNQWQILPEKLLIRKFRLLFIFYTIQYLHSYGKSNLGSFLIRTNTNHQTLSLSSHHNKKKLTRLNIQPTSFLSSNLSSTLLTLTKQHFAWSGGEREGRTAFATLSALPSQNFLIFQISKVPGSTWPPSRSPRNYPCRRLFCRFQIWTIYCGVRSVPQQKPLLIP